MDARSELEKSAGRRGIRWMRSADESMSKKEELVRSRTASEEKNECQEGIECERRRRKRAMTAKAQGAQGSSAIVVNSAR